MMSKYLSQLFVGRTAELAKLEDAWSVVEIPRTIEKHVLALLNAPGVGKTALLEHFGNRLMEEQRGLLVEIRALNSMKTINLYYTNFLKK